MLQVSDSPNVISFKLTLESVQFYNGLWTADEMTSKAYLLAYDEKFAAVPPSGDGFKSYAPFVQVAPIIRTDL